MQSYRNTDYKSDDIAIIGMAGRFPDADTLEEFWTNIATGKDSVREFPESRIEELEIMLSEKPAIEFIKEGYLNQTILFEPEIFSLSKEESKYLDPQQRLLLELVEESVLDAGYNPTNLMTKQVGVFIAENENNYLSEFGVENIMALINSASSSNAGRIAYTYGFQGPALTIGSACSSSLVAVHLACQSLKLREIDYAISGGVRLWFLPPDRRDLLKSPIASQREKIRAFDKNADGTIGGEGGGIVLLKLLENALADGDNIHAIIKGSGINNNGNRSNGINAPSEEAQADVIINAINRTGKELGNLAYIETHGTGTRIGDPIEIGGLSTALTKLGYPQGSVPIGSLKSNIGHLDSAAGIAGLLKAILILKARTLPPSINFTSPNPQIDFAKSPVYVNTQLIPYNKADVMRVGVTSLGLIGTNAHFILEEEPRHDSFPLDSPNIITLRARTKDSLIMMLDKLKSYLVKHPYLSLNDIAYTLNTGRRKFDKLFVCIADSVSSLIQEIDNSQLVITDLDQVKAMSIALIIPDYDLESVEFTDLSKNNIFNKYLDQIMIDIERISASRERDKKLDFLANYYAYYRLLETYSIKVDAVLGIGLGEVVARLIKGEINLSKAVDFCTQYVRKQTLLDEERLAKVVTVMQDKGLNTFLYLSMEPALKRLFNSYLHKDSICIALDNNQQSFFQGVKSLIQLGQHIDWDRVYQGQGRRLSLPGYVFDRKRYYLTKQKTIVFLPGDFEEQTFVDNTDVGHSYKQILERAVDIMLELQPDNKIDFKTQFFDLGFSSIKIMHFIGKIKSEYNVKIPLETFFDDIPTGDLLEKIARIIVAKGEEDYKIPVQPIMKNYPASASQKRIYVSQKNTLNNTSYNLIFGMWVEGILDREKFSKAVHELCQRHEALRTVFEFTDNGLVQIIDDSVKVDITYLSVTEDMLPEIMEKFVRPFDLAKAPLFRVGLVELAPEKTLIIMDIHHIIADGTSLEVMLSDFIKLYSGEDLSALRIQYKDYSVWQENFLQSESIQGHKEYWLNIFKGNLPEIKLPYDYPRPTGTSFIVDQVTIELGSELTAKINQLTKQLNGSLYMILLAFYNILLSKYTLKEDIIVCSPVLGRPNADLENVVGMFVNTLAMRNYPTSSKTFADFFAELRANTLQAFENQMYPVDELVHQLKLSGYGDDNPLFTTVFALQNSLWNTTQKEYRIQDTVFKTYSLINQRTKFDLTFEIFEKENSLTCNLLYAKELFKQETMKLFGNNFKKIGELVVANSQIRLIDIELKSAQDHKKTSRREKIDFEFDID